MRTRNYMPEQIRNRNYAGKLSVIFSVPNRCWYVRARLLDRYPHMCVRSSSIGNHRHVYQYSSTVVNNAVYVKPYQIYQMPTNIKLIHIGLSLRCGFKHGVSLNICCIYTTPQLYSLTFTSPCIGHDVGSMPCFYRQSIRFKYVQIS